MSASAEHTISKKTYFLVFGALLVLTGLTTQAAYFEFGGIGPIPASAVHLGIALLIATTKAALVIVYFMHVRHATGLTRLFIGAGVFWLFILMLYTFADLITR